MEGLPRHMFVFEGYPSQFAVGLVKFSGSAEQSLLLALFQFEEHVGEDDVEREF
jgi:hypothetical protein